MRKTLHIWQCDVDTILRLRIMALARGVPMAALLQEMTEDFWGRDSTVATTQVKRRIRDLVRRYLRKV